MCCSSARPSPTATWYLPYTGKIPVSYTHLLIVFALSGLWHGAAMKYVLWGLLFGVFQVIGGLLTPAKQRLCAALHISWDAGWLQIIRAVSYTHLDVYKRQPSVWRCRC